MPVALSAQETLGMFFVVGGWKMKLRVVASGQIRPSWTLAKRLSTSTGQPADLCHGQDCTYFNLRNACSEIKWGGPRRQLAVAAR